MRLSFATAGLSDRIVVGGAVTLGSAPGNDVVLAASDVAPWHARIVADRRGLVLEVLDPAAVTHVNARPIRERALLRLGDTLCLGRSVILLKADRDDDIAGVAAPPLRAQAATTEPARAMLRGVGGDHFGRSLGIRSTLVVGRDPRCDLTLPDHGIAARHAAIENGRDGLWLRDLGSADGSLVNGVRVRDAAVYPDDQIVFAGHHFVVEAPGFPRRGDVRPLPRHAITGVQPVLPSKPTSAPASSERDAAAAAGMRAIFWLLVVATLIALGLVMLFHRGL